MVRFSILSLVLVVGACGDDDGGGSTGTSGETSTSSTGTAGTGSGSSGTTAATGGSSGAATGTETGAGTETGTGTGSGTDSGSGATTGSSSGSTGGSGVDCESEPFTFPEFDKSCQGDDDCFTAIHIVDCCGTSEAVGLSFGEMGAFDAAEAMCQMQSPQCDCPPGPTTTEDGKETYNHDLIQVICESGMCTTFLP